MTFAPSTHNLRNVRFGGESKASLLQRLAEAQVHINSAGLQLFSDERFCTSMQSQVVIVTLVSVASLGLARGGVMEQVVIAAKAQGLSVCPLELAPHLRVQWQDQEEGAVGSPEARNRAPPGSITIISTPLSENDEVPQGFYLRRIEGKLWLRGYTSWAGHAWQPEDMLVFMGQRRAA
jgi:hypothetical protein